MAKSKNNQITNTGLERPNKSRGSRVVVLIVILIVVIAMGVSVFVFREPILGFARKIPVINKIVPVGETVVKELTMEELVEINKDYEKDLERLTKDIELLETNYKELQSRNEILQKYEDQYLDFISQKEEWDTEIASQNPELYISYYEEIYPETAGEIYKILKGDILLTNEQQATIKAVQKMDQEQAAKALEVLLSTDRELVKIIMGNMKGDERSVILDNMKSESAATVIKLILPWEGGIE